MTPTTIDKDNPDTWPPDSDVLAAVQFGDAAEGGGTVRGSRDILRLIRSAPQAWHGDRWWLLDTAPKRATEEPSEPEDDGLVEVRVAVVVDADGKWGAMGHRGWGDDTSRDELMDWLAIEPPYRRSVGVLRVRPYAEPAPAEVRGVVEEA